MVGRAKRLAEVALELMQEADRRLAPVIALTSSVTVHPIGFVLEGQLDQQVTTSVVLLSVGCVGTIAVAARLFPWMA